MQTLFNRSPSPERGIAISGQWNVARAGLSRNLAQVIHYFHNRSMAIKNNHLLVRLINTPRLNYEQPVERFYEQIDVQSTNLAMFYKLTCAVFAGELHDGVFYGAGTKEIIIGSSESFDVHEASEHWMDQTPVKIISHNKTDLDMHIPNGIAYSQEHGLAVISINIPLLFVMYRGFVQEQMAALRRGQQAKITSQFIHTYVLPNAIASHLDYALFNRALSIAVDRTPAMGTSRKHPFALPNWTTQTDKVLKELVTHLKRTTTSMHDILCTLPAVSSVNCAQTMQLPAVSPTYQYAWSELVARAQTMVGLMLLSPDKLLGYDKARLQYISRLIAFDGFKPVISKKVPGQQGEEIIALLETVEQVARAS